MALPDFLIIGSPKAGSTALHVALAQHPDLFLSDPKEPKFFMCDRAKPDPAHQRGPGDAHSAQEWVWDPARTRRCSRPHRPAPCAGRARRSTCGTRIPTAAFTAAIPDVKMIAVIRDPIDRAYSNWGHLWCDGLEPESDFLRACDLEPARIDGRLRAILAVSGDRLVRAATRAPVRGIPEGAGLRAAVPAIDRQHARRFSTRSAEFLGVRTGHGQHHSAVECVELGAGHPDQYDPAEGGPGRGGRRRAPAAAGVAAGATAAAGRPVSGWRSAADVAGRSSARRLLPYFEADNALLGRLTGVDYSDWLNEKGRGAFTERQ